MRLLRRGMASLLSLLLLLNLSGCWNYTEVDDMAIVAGVAIDKNEADGKLLLTVELVDTNGGMDKTQAGFKMISLSGDTMFEIVRNIISITGKKLFWSHAKSIILSREVAREGLIKAIDWYSRDTETRSDVFIFVSGEKTAREVLNLNSTTETIMSFELAQMMRDEKFISTAPAVEIWDFIDKLETKGNNATAPMISIHEENNKQNERVTGTAIFKKDRMVGSLNGDESKSMLFVKNKIKGGVLDMDDKQGNPAYSLEIISNQTKVKPRIVDGRLQMQIHTVTKTGLDEVMTPQGFGEGESIQDIEQRAGERLQTDILAVIHKLQREYDADVFGFGEMVFEEQPKVWAKVKDHWLDTFADLDVTVSSKVIIQSSAKTSRAIRPGD
ncbi:Ger(x)C family spore germination protein [Paenibacillus tritici]|uniref:Ger(X)C family spore germination protein n=1 Tax=Paenibacillus tritici TaxID=1873425 RepID=A0ABX2DXB2_9BACL|nr:Ger(x)C family spore germination protein [Paenibacillus tritici]NQX48784.1 Ger(x)C family spore germination protein [Paenibacillus tritici]